MSDPEPGTGAGDGGPGAGDVGPGAGGVDPGAGDGPGAGDVGPGAGDGPGDGDGAGPAGAGGARVVGVGFRPSRDGFRFGNAWPAGAPVRLAGLPLGRVRGGLCGGMAYEARRAWLAGAPLPADTRAPVDGRLADRLWRAQLSSLRLPLGPLRYLWFQLPPLDRGRRRLTLTRGLPALRRELAADRPALLGLVRTVSWDPRAVVEHHVVLGYGLAETPDGRAEVSVYDPNHPGDDTVRLRVDPDGTVRCSHRGEVVAFTVLGAGSPSARP